MSSERETLRPYASTVEQLREHKREGESWDGFLQRAIEALASPNLVCSKCSSEAEAFTVENGELRCPNCWLRPENDAQ